MTEDPQGAGDRGTGVAAQGTAARLAAPAKKAARPTAPPARPKLILVRTGKLVEAKGEDGKVYKAYRSVIHVEGHAKSFPAIERADGRKHLPEGDHAAIFQPRNRFIAANKPDHPEIKVVEYGDGRVYFHPANTPDELEGCIAPGTSVTDTGVAGSRAALDEIILALGGWTRGDPLTVEVRGYKETAGALETAKPQQGAPANE